MVAMVARRHAMGETGGDAPEPGLRVMTHAGPTASLTRVAKTAVEPEVMELHDPRRKKRPPQKNLDELAKIAAERAEAHALVEAAMIKYRHCRLLDVALARSLACWRCGHTFVFS